MASSPLAVNAASGTLLWSLVQQFMLRHTGNVLRDDQAYLMDARLSRVSRTLGFASVNEFVTATCTGQPAKRLSSALIDALTTHETMFFRDATFWRELQASVLPQLIERAQSGRQIKIWSAACSTGQEVYSLAILLREAAPQLLQRFEIIATDIAEATLQQASNGFYSSLEVNRGLDIRRLSKYFVQAPGGFRINEELRKSITWQTHNLLGTNADHANCDVVLCRNVLIYFNELERNSILKRLIKAVSPGGVFGIGTTESCRDPGLQPVASGLYRKSN